MRHRVLPWLVALGWLAPLAGSATALSGVERSLPPVECIALHACWQFSDNLPPAPQYLPGSGTSLPRSAAPPTPAAAEDFTRRISNSWCLPAVNGNSIASSFAPDLSGLTDLNALANLGGFDHFNIEQDIVEISEGDLPTKLPRWTGVDPALGGNTFYQFDDAFPWYYDEVATPGQWMPRYDDAAVHSFNPSGQDSALEWRDAPNVGPQNAGVTFTFVDYLVGVQADHSGVRISEAFPDARNVNFQWSFTQGNWGTNRNELIRFGGFDEVEPGSQGSVVFLGFFGSDPSQLSATPGNPCQAPDER